MSKKILMLGASGMVGVSLYELLKQKNYIYTTYYQNKHYDNELKINVNSEQELEKTFLCVNPDIVINLSGVYKNLDFCEKNKELTMNVNGLALKTISNLANKFDSFLVTVSTDQVFDGYKGNYRELDKICPINHYGKTKAAGEKIVQNIAKKYCIIRTSMLWGRNQIRKTFSEFILNEIKHKNKLKLIQDQTTTPTYLENFCEMFSEVIEKEILGIIHLSGPEKLSRYEFGKKILGLAGLDKEKIIPSKRQEFDFGKYMPRDTSLNTDRTIKLLRVHPEKVETSIQKYLHETN